MVGSGKMMAETASGERRTVGDYILGKPIGYGSFAVVWLGLHRKHGFEVAVKEIDKKKVSGKLRDCLLKEIAILRQISHPNIIRLYEAIQTEEKIYLVLEYCAGGDLAGYFKRHGTHGRVSDNIARYFMRQLAEGLKVLRENNLIHRDLKPQNLLLSTSKETPVLKIGDFGFARYLMPQGLADTVCGSPLYMAPEIIQDRKYDAKADLWSVGAILFQLVTGKLPFNGDSHFQLFQNIMTSKELQFPPNALVNLHPDCIDLCRSLLRQNPVERLTFEEFFNHKFMSTPRIPEAPIESENTPDSNSQGPEQLSVSLVSNLKIRSTEKGFSFTNSSEEEYVLVDANFSSTEMSFSLEIPLKNNSISRFPSHSENIYKQEYAGPVQSTEPVFSYIPDAESIDDHVSPILSSSQTNIVSQECQGTSSLHPFSRILHLNQYIDALTELAQEKLDAGVHLESFAVELIILVLWRETLRLCNVWTASRNSGASDHSFSANDFQSHKRDHVSPNIESQVDHTNPLSVCLWAQRGFLTAYGRTEKFSNRFENRNGDLDMPDAIEIIFQKALAAGKIGAVDELMEHWSKAAAAYSQAITFLTFITVEATSLPLNPPFSLSPQDHQRLHRYIETLRTRLEKVSNDTSSLQTNPKN